MKYLLSCICFICCFPILSQEQNFSTQDIAINKNVDGTLLVPNSGSNHKLVIIIADYGPTDRDGNQNFSKHFALKKLAESLSNQGIATYRYDKRIVKQIRRNRVDPNMKFEDFVSDAEAVINHFKDDPAFSGLYVIGHGQGSLVGMLASTNHVSGFISLAGSGLPINEVITNEVTAMDPSLGAQTKAVFNILKTGQQTSDYPPALASVFDKDVQPFLISWMQYDPRIVIQTLKIPSLIITGTKDLQVTSEEAKELLAASNDLGELKMIENMNHVLVTITGDDLENSKSYNESSRKVNNELITALASFISDN